MTPETLLSNLEELKGKKTEFITALKEVIKSTMLSKFEEGCDRPCQDSDFVEHKKKSEVSFNNLKLIIDDCVNTNFFDKSSTRVKSTSPDIDNELLALILIACGENACPKPWNTDEIVNICANILSSVLKLFNINSPSELFSNINKRGLVKEVFQILNPKLLSTTWKHFPASVACYKWILEMIEQPQLSDYLQVVLPTALLLVDDYVCENNIIGIICLNHIVNNLTTAELQFYRHGDVIFNALMPMLRIRDASVISCALPCLVSVTTKLETDFGKKNPTKWSRFDDILEIYLENMEMEQMIDLRNSYISNLELMIDATGCSIARWSKRLMRIFKEYLQIAAKHKDEAGTNYCLKAIEKYMELTKPLMSLYRQNLLFSLFLTFSNINSNSESKVQAENKEIAHRLCKTILQSYPSTEKATLKKHLLEKLQANNFNSLHNEICNVLEDSYENTSS